MSHPASPRSKEGTKEVSIPRTHFREGQVVFYEIRFAKRVKNKLLTDVCFHRYSEFLTLHTKLRNTFKDIELPEFPGKKIFGNKDAAFVDKRRQQLESYLIGLQRHADPRISLNEDLLAFLPEAYGRFLHKVFGYIHFRVTEVTPLTKKTLNVQVSPLHQEVRLVQITGSSSTVQSIHFNDILSVEKSRSVESKCYLTYAQDYKDECTLDDEPRATITSESKRKSKSKDDLEVNPVFLKPDLPTPPRRSEDDLSIDTRSLQVIVDDTKLLTPKSSTDTRPSHSSGDDGGKSLIPPMVTRKQDRFKSSIIITTSGDIAPSLLNSKVKTSKRRAFVFSSIEDRIRFTRLLGSLEAVVNDPRTRFSSDPSLLEKDVEFLESTVFTSSWNMAKEPPPSDINGWIPQGGDRKTFVVVGLQECTQSQQVMIDLVQRQLGEKYYLLAKKGLWEIRLLIFARKDVAPLESIESLRSSSVATGIMGIMGNKGGVAISFRFHTLSFCFVNSHLAPHQPRFDDRNRMYHDILAGLQPQLGMGLDITMAYDLFWWLGDLNYRIDLPHKKVVELIMRRKWMELYCADQLRRARLRFLAFRGFKEGQLQFPPTYKFVLKSTKKKKKKNKSKPKPKPSAGTEASQLNVSRTKMVPNPLASDNASEVSVIPEGDENEPSESLRMATSPTFVPKHFPQAQKHSISESIPPPAPETPMFGDHELMPDVELPRSQSPKSMQRQHSLKVQQPTPILESIDTSDEDDTDDEEEQAAMIGLQLRARDRSMSDARVRKSVRSRHSTINVPRAVLEATEAQIGNSDEEVEADVQEHLDWLEGQSYLDVFPFGKLHHLRVPANKETSDWAQDHGLSDAQDWAVGMPQALTQSERLLLSSVYSSAWQYAWSQSLSRQAQTDRRLRPRRHSVDNSVGSHFYRHPFVEEVPKNFFLRAPRVVALENDVVFETRKRAQSVREQAVHKKTVQWGPDQASDEVKVSNFALKRRGPNCKRLHVRRFSDTMVQQPHAERSYVSMKVGFDYHMLTAGYGRSGVQPPLTSRILHGTLPGHDILALDMDIYSAAAAAHPFEERYDTVDPDDGKFSFDASRSRAGAIESYAMELEAHGVRPSAEMKDLLRTGSRSVSNYSFSKTRSMTDSQLNPRASLYNGGPFLRSYKKNRIPSWCDRILWKTSEALSHKVFQQSYFSCEDVVSSDHLPVVSSFSLKIPKQPPVIAYSYPCDVVFSTLRAYIPDCFQLLESQKSLRSSRHTQDAEHHLYVSFTGAFLSETSRGKRTSDGIMKPPHGVLLWNSEEIPMLQTTLGMRQAVQLERLFFSVKAGNTVDGQDYEIGQGTINFRNIASQDAWDFSSEITKEGQPVGNLSGNISVLFEFDS